MQNLDLLGIMTVSITLFAVIDMLGNIPLIIKLKDEYGRIDSLKGSIISSIIMVSMLFFGKTIFSLLGIETFHFGLAGSFLIIYFGIKMVLDLQIDNKLKKKSINPTIFPIVFPLIAGPGTLSTIMSMRSEYADFTIISGIIINSVFIFLILNMADVLKNKIGMTGIQLLERIFGIILIAIGMKMFIYNLIMSINSVISII